MNPIPLRIALSTIMALLLVGPGVVNADQNLKHVSGVVSEVRLVDATAMGGETFLILSLEEGRSFLLAGQSQLPAGQGVKVQVSYQPAAEADQLPSACSVEVVAVPIEVDGEVRLQTAQRPFRVFGSDEANCP
jgi:hypothetical protein